MPLCGAWFVRAGIGIKFPAKIETHLKSCQEHVGSCLEVIMCLICTQRLHLYNWIGHWVPWGQVQSLESRSLIMALSQFLAADQL